MIGAFPANTAVGAEEETSAKKLTFGETLAWINKKLNENPAGNFKSHLTIDGSKLVFITIGPKGYEKKVAAYMKTVQFAVSSDGTRAEMRCLEQGKNCIRLETDSQKLMAPKDLLEHTSDVVLAEKLVKALTHLLRVAPTGIDRDPF